MCSWCRDVGMQGLRVWGCGSWAPTTPYHEFGKSLSVFRMAVHQKNIRDFIFFGCGSPWPGGKAFGEAVAQQGTDRDLILPVLVLLERNAARFSVLNTLYFYPDAIIHPKVAGRVAGGAGCCLEMRGGCSQPSCFLSQVCDFPQHHFAAVIHAPGLPPSPLPMFPIS